MRIKPIRLTNEQEKEIIDLYLNNTSLKEILNKYHLSNESRIYKILTKYSILTRRIKINDEFINSFKYLYYLGLSWVEMAKKLDCSIDCIHDNAKKLKLSHKDKRRMVNINYFENDTNPNVQYWLGYLCTDGCINEDRISLYQKELDKDIIYKFNEFLGGNVTIREVIDKKFNKEFKQIGLSFRNKEICKTLNSFGITSRKTFTLKMNINITFDFIRGVIDGDGSINKNVIRICSASKGFIDQISQFLYKYEIRNTIFKYEGRSIYDLQVCDSFSLLKLIDFLYYKGCTYYMNRKYNNAQQLRNKLLERFKLRELPLENPEASQQSEEEIIVEKM